MNCNYDQARYQGSYRYDDNCGCSEGRRRLELAIGHVPMQEWQNLYNSEKALRAGTMFAELNLPFKGGRRK